MVFQDPYASLNARMTIGAALSEPLPASGPVQAGRAGGCSGAAAQVGLTAEHLTATRAPFREASASASRSPAPWPRTALHRRRRAGFRARRLHPGRGDPSAARPAARARLSLMFVSHDLSVIEMMADRVLVLYLGRVMEIAPAAEIYSRPAHPYTAALLQAAPGGRRGAPGPRRRDPEPARSALRMRVPHALPLCPRRCAEAVRRYARCAQDTRRPVSATTSPFEFPASPGPLLVVGGRGFVGSHVVRALIAAGARPQLFGPAMGEDRPGSPVHSANESVHRSPIRCASPCGHASPARRLLRRAWAAGSA